MSSEGKDYLRVKRNKQTYFVPASPSDNFLTVKTEVSKAMNDAILPSFMRLFLVKGEGEESKVLPDGATLADHEVKSSDLLYVTFVKDWEDRQSDDNLEEADWETLTSVRSTS